ncbi:MAG: bifunctional DNA-formamidopyrimidine glycosylase/DNA-(apurinic or apyrimidinic site) lyase [Firmicutes bacterium]|nr:bifunctional DNA-formamidopyrimidine glycosylase/DNA-(apurinic or apyrimidinic site) lyase [Bacillota bacterium]
MPELPEVETVRRSLAALLEGQTIARVDVRLARLIRTPDVAVFVATLAGVPVLAVRRRAKYLLFDLGDHVLISHLRMEGRYGMYAAGDPEDAHTHVVFTLADGRELRYRDVRQFGTFDLIRVEALNDFSALGRLGPEPDDEEFDVPYLRERLGGRTAPIKSLLLDQTVVAGLGNIYVDEILHRAGIHPERPAGRLKQTDLRRLVEHTRQVIGESIMQGGSSIKSYVSGYGAPGAFQFSLRVYGREGKPCLTCGREIVKGRVGGRGTHVCLSCQKPPRTAAIRSVR